jgi:hypothetical protein
VRLNGLIKSRDWDVAQAIKNADKGAHDKNSAVDEAEA